MGERGRERERNQGLRTRDRRTAQSKSRFRSQGRGGFTHGNRTAKGQGKRDEGARVFDPRVYNQATAYFFTNSSAEWTFEQMWRTFKKFGVVLDIYCPNRKGKDGKRFSFVRFQGVADEIALESQLDMIVVDGLKLRVNWPSFSKSRRNMPLETKKKQPSYEMKGIKEASQKWLEERRSQGRRRAQGIRTRAMGGKLVLIDVDDKEELKNLVETGKDWLRQWFAEIKEYAPTIIASERFVWLKIQGVPPNSWNSKFFATITTMWRKFISLDDSTRLKKRFDIARALISTPATEAISKSFKFKINEDMVNPNEDEDAWSWDSELGELQRDEFFQIQEDIGEDVDETTCKTWVKEKSFAFQNFQNFEKRGDVEEKEASINEGGGRYRLLQEIEGREGSMEMVGDSLQAAQEKQSHKCMMFSKEVGAGKKESMAGEIYRGSNGSFGIGVMAQMGFNKKEKDVETNRKMGRSKEIREMVAEIDLGQCKDNPLDCSSLINGPMKENKEGPMEDTNFVIP
ncbi:hypothetical protein SLEP1_g54658 [Rubroshorea leprosula]|uniref:RRM domain-containing protein n=1 Tax=Rubroshorea leprosula TaxID=152421 RepID=A0AAV5MD46_9ROSI|nr:hypothetical protein SLEP1_g54658 [Rubroshorea leprosula]